MHAETSRATAESQIRALIDSWTSAVRSRDVDRVLAHYAPDVLAFDAVSHLEFRGREAYGRHWRACLDLCPGPMVFEVHDLSVTAAHDIAYGHFLSRCGGTDASGELKSSWFRATECYRRTNGQWVIAHEHFSVPFDMESGKALLDLTP
jgi:uncharacterized protein (TIGR02246 family)